MNLTIIIPAYNSEKYISRCLNSVLCCPDSSLEVIIVNDGSTDNTSTLVSGYMKKDTRIKFISQTNKGVSTARNSGIVHASRDYISFLDSDDTLMENWWNLVPVNLDDADLIVFDFVRTLKGVDHLNKLNLDRGKIKNEDILKEYVLTDDLNSSCGKLYKLSFLRQYRIAFPQSIKIGEDAIFVGKCLENRPNIRYINEPFFKYEENLISATHKSLKDLSDQASLLTFKADLLWSTGQYEIADDFYKKALGDFISELRYTTSDYKNYKNICNLLDKYQYIRALLNYKYKNLDSRRKMQLSFLKRKKYNILYLELSLERKLLR